MLLGSTVGADGGVKHHNETHAQTFWRRVPGNGTADDQIVERLINLVDGSSLNNLAAGVFLASAVSGYGLIELPPLELKRLIFADSFVVRPNLSTPISKAAPAHNLHPRRQREDHRSDFDSNELCFGVEDWRPIIGPQSTPSNTDALAARS